MLEVYEFVSILFTILGGDAAILYLTMQCKHEVSDVQKDTLNLRSDMELEFAKCRLHECNTKKE